VATRYTLARMGAELSSVYAQKGTMKDVLARCLKKTDVQVCTLSSVHVQFCNVTFTLLLHTYLLWPAIVVSFRVQLCMCNNRCLFFRRLKINHESHEFILDSGTAANSYSIKNDFHCKNHN
jgi:hypothetical protein